MLIRDWLRHPIIDARAWVVHSLLTIMSVEDAFAFHAWVPVKFSVAYEIAGVSSAIWISFAVDDRAFAAVATVHREFGFWWTVSK